VWPVCPSVTVSPCLCVWSGVCVACVPVCDSVTLSVCGQACVWSVCPSVTLPSCHTVCVWPGMCVVCVPVCDTVCVWSGVCVVCVPVCDTAKLSHCHADNDKLLLFTVSNWPTVHYDSVYRWRPHSRRHQVLRFLSSVTHKMRFL